MHRVVALAGISIIFASCAHSDKSPEAINPGSYPFIDGTCDWRLDAPEERDGVITAVGVSSTRPAGNEAVATALAAGAAKKNTTDFLRKLVEDQVARAAATRGVTVEILSPSKVAGAVHRIAVKEGKSSVRSKGTCIKYIDATSIIAYGLVEYPYTRVFAAGIEVVRNELNSALAKSEGASNREQIEQALALLGDLAPGGR
jgi:hypothetical protein